MDRFEKFCTSRQPPVQLQIAMEDFFLPELGEKERATYGAYIQKRIRAAVEQLILQDDSEKLEKLQKLGWFPWEQVDDFLKTAVAAGKNEAWVWLMEQKETGIGFHKREFPL